MRREDINWKVLRGAVIALAISITLTSTMVYGSYYFEKSMQQEYTKNNAAFKNISRKYLAIDEEEKLIKKYFPDFIELYNNGVIGTEQRLNWVEILRTSGQEINLPSLSYQIESQDVYSPGFPVKLGKYKLYASKMTLNMRLLHEGDLFQVLDVLNKDARGTYNLGACKLIPSMVIMERADAANISVTCDLQWFTIKLANGKEINV